MRSAAFWIRVFVAALLAIFFQTNNAMEPPAGYKLVVDESFDITSSHPPAGWSIQTGMWIPRNGILEAREIEADHHAAAARKSIVTRDAFYQVKFRLPEGSKGFHLGFDPKKGSLKKKGHLFSVIIQPHQWRIMKHLDKSAPEKDPNEVLARQIVNLETGKWYTLTVSTSGESVSARIDKMDPLTGSHPTFDVPKPTVVFRALAEGADLDDLKVWVPAKLE